MQGAIAVCYGGGRWWVNFGGADVAVGDHCGGGNKGEPTLGVPSLLGVIAGCHCSVLWWRGGDGRPTLREWTWHQGGGR